MRIRISTYLDAPADRVWQAVKRPVTLLHVTRGMLGFLPARAFPREWQVGQLVRVRLIFLHCLPLWRHELRVVDINEASREIHSAERGGLVAVWNHWIHLEPVPRDRCRCTDEIDIETGLWTPAVWLFAYLFYSYRQRRWRQLARSLAKASTTR